MHAFPAVELTESKLKTINNENSAIRIYFVTNIRLYSYGLLQLGEHTIILQTVIKEQLDVI